MRPPFGPIAGTERIASLDVLRGFALWGVLLINMMNFGALADGQWTAPLDQFAFWAQRFFFEQKFWRLFSLLFGVGFALQLLRSTERGGGFITVYVRRLAVLLSFGLLHYLIYPGDILVPYAIVGLALLFFRDLSPARLLVLAALLLLVHPVAEFARPRDRQIAPARPVDPIARIHLRGGPDVQYRARTGSAATLPDRLRLRAGRAGDIWIARAKRLPSHHLDPRTHWRGSESWPVYLAMFLLGLYAGKRRVFQDFHANRALISRSFRYGLPLGLLAMTADWIFRDFVSGPLPDAARLLREIIWAFGATALALGYGAGLLLLLQRARWRDNLSPLGSMGRMALTVYLTQSIIFTTLFLDYGFDLQRRVGPAAVFAYAAVIYAVQLAICVWWMRRYQFGPFEWLWRTLTYARWQPMRSRSPVGAPGLVDHSTPVR